MEVSGAVLCVWRRILWATAWRVNIWWLIGVSSPIIRRCVIYSSHNNELFLLHTASPSSRFLLLECSPLYILHFTKSYSFSKLQICNTLLSPPYVSLITFHPSHPQLGLLTSFCFMFHFFLFISSPNHGPSLAGCYSFQWCLCCSSLLAWPQGPNNPPKRAIALHDLHIPPCPVSPLHSVWCLEELRKH